jgi:hypothetical protein
LDHAGACVLGGGVFGCPCGRLYAWVVSLGESAGWLLLVWPGGGAPSGASFLVSALDVPVVVRMSLRVSCSDVKASSGLLPDWRGWA